MSRMMAALYSLGNLLYFLLIEIQSFFLTQSNRSAQLQMSCRSFSHCRSSWSTLFEAKITMFISTSVVRPLSSSSHWITPNTSSDSVFSYGPGQTPFSQLKSGSPEVKNTPISSTDPSITAISAVSHFYSPFRLTQIPTCEQFNLSVGFSGGSIAGSCQSTLGGSSLTCTSTLASLLVVILLKEKSVFWGWYCMLQPLFLKYAQFMGSSMTIWLCESMISFSSFFKNYRLFHFLVPKGERVRWRSGGLRNRRGNTALALVNMLINFNTTSLQSQSQSQSNQMKSLLFLMLNLLLAAALFYAYYDPNKETVAAVSQRECLDQQQSKVFCAQCLRRSKQPALHPQKAFLIAGAEHYAVLKIPGKTEHLACHEYLQLADYARGDQGSRLPLPLEQIGSVIALMGELQGEYIGNAAGESVVSADFQQAVIYRWFSAAEEKNTLVRVADSSQLQQLRKVLLCVVNGVILLLGGLYLRNKESFSHLKPKVLACIGLLLAGLDLLAFDLLADSPFPLILVRQLILAACLMRVETSSGAVGFMVFLGLLCSLVSFGFLLNILVVLVIVIAKGSNEQNVREIWRYIMGSLLIYIADHLIWEAMFVERGDTGCQFVEMLLLGLTPLGLTLIKDAKYVGFKVYKGEQKRHSISLSGYEQEEEEEEQI